MARDWEATFDSWAQPPGKTEQDKYNNAESAIREAISKSDRLSSKSVTVFPQGSYRNRTNVRAESDVDICVFCDNSFFFDLPDGTVPNDVGISVPWVYSYQEFRNDVEAALVSRFGASSVVRGNKAFDVHANTYRVDADVVACFEYRWYERRDLVHTGTAFLSDRGSRINNWPQQNYDNGVAKNETTGRRFKGVVRILKRLRNEMADNGHVAANPIPSFLLECLTWNVPNDGFGHDTWRADVRYALAHLYNNTVSDDKCATWGEINELKYLFGAWQAWRRADVNAFLDAAWKYVDFE